MGERSANPRPKVPILERSIRNSIIRGSKLVQELNPQPRLLVLVPIERCLYIPVRPSVGDEPVGIHSFLRPSRSSTSYAEPACCGLHW